jgi:addiction module HigA family antidote
VGEILAGKRRISADTGLRLSRALGLSDMFWINLQARYDADVVRTEKSDELAHISRLATSGS